MVEINNLIRVCLRPECRFRFPTTTRNLEVKCPRCGSPTRLVENPYPGMKVPLKTEITDNSIIEVLFDNIRSAFNVGSMFRTADGAGVQHIHICGITPTPDHPKVTKTALGAECAIPWTQHWDSLQAVRSIQENGYKVWALEGGENSIPIFDVLAEYNKLPLLMVIGNEVTGIDPGILDICDHKVFIPMQGVKQSLNVAIAFGIAIYFIRFGNRLS